MSQCRRPCGDECQPQTHLRQRQCSACVLGDTAGQPAAAPSRRNAFSTTPQICGKRPPEPRSARPAAAARRAAFQRAQDPPPPRAVPERSCGSPAPPAEKGCAEQPLDYPCAQQLNQLIGVALPQFQPQLGKSAKKIGECRGEQRGPTGGDQPQPQGAPARRRPTGRPHPARRRRAQAVVLRADTAPVRPRSAYSAGDRVP